eukprot:g4599.t1
MTTNNNCSKRRLEEAQKERKRVKCTVYNVLSKHVFEKLEAKKNDFKIAKPFSHLSIDSFVEQSNMLENVKEELSSLSYNVKNNDLYQFYQSSEDLASINNLPHLQMLRDMIYSEKFIKVIEKISGTKLSKNKIDMSAAVYRKSNYLALHDDQLEGRKVAWILYLVDENWKESDGGALELFGVDKNKQPWNVEKSITPRFNHFVFFEVTKDSWHRVAEVVSNNPRITISGWFHSEEKGEEIMDSQRKNIELPRMLLSNSVDLSQYINPIYLDKENISNIRDGFVKHSSHMLRDFLRKDKLDNLVEKIRGSTDFERVAFPQHQWYYRTKLEEWKRFFLSKEFGKWLESVTTLKIEKGSSEARKFKKGNYTLIDDEDFNNQTTLDVVLNLSEGEWGENTGGFMTYLAEEEELLTVPCDEINSLCIVLRDEGVGRFVKYLNGTAPSDRIDIVGVYEFEEDEDENEEEDGEEEALDDEDVAEIEEEMTMGFGQSAMIHGHHKK